MPLHDAPMHSIAPYDRAFRRHCWSLQRSLLCLQCVKKVNVADINNIMKARQQFMQQQTENELVKQVRHALQGW